MNRNTFNKLLCLGVMTQTVNPAGHMFWYRRNPIILITSLQLSRISKPGPDIPWTHLYDAHKTHEDALEYAITQWLEKCSD